jgi:hypothetical protein
VEKEVWLMGRKLISLDGIFELFLIFVGAGLITLTMRDVIKTWVIDNWGSITIMGIPADIVLLLTIGLGLVITGRYLKRRF